MVHGIPSDPIDAGGHLVCDLLTGFQGCCKTAGEGAQNAGGVPEWGGSVFAWGMDTLRTPSPW